MMTRTCTGQAGQYRNVIGDVRIAVVLIQLIENVDENLQCSIADVCEYWVIIYEESDFLQVVKYIILYY